MAYFPDIQKIREMSFGLKFCRLAAGRMYLLLLTTLLFAAHGVFVSCDDNEDFTTSPSAKLTFPADTLRLDTALTVVSSPTYSFTVHNRTSKGIRITNVALANSESSGFRVNVDGTFINEDYDYAIEVRSHDSIAVWVDITPRFQDSDDPILVTDRLMFTLESGVVQQVVLQAVTQDVNVMEHVLLDKDTCLSSRRPYFVKDTLRVAEGSTLTISPGVRMLFAPKAGMLVEGTLVARGERDSLILFRGGRMDYMFDGQPYDRIPGQWGGITFASSSYDNEMEYCDVHSGTFGIRCDSSDVTRRKLTVENSIVNNMKGDCLTLVNSDILVGNSQITNAMGNTVTVHGGRNRFVHCTIANFYPFTGGRGKALYLFNSLNGTPLPLVEATFGNCILSGWSADEVGFMFLDEPSLQKNYLFESCLITAEASDDTEHYRNNVFESPDDEVWGSDNFISFDNETLIYDFRLDTLSRARNMADTVITKDYYPEDFYGVVRLVDKHSDAGCYEFE